jgi:hypothetical protein
MPVLAPRCCLARRTHTGAAAAMARVRPLGASNAGYSPYPWQRDTTWSVPTEKRSATSAGVFRAERQDLSPLSA